MKTVNQDRALTALRASVKGQLKRLDAEAEARRKAEDQAAIERQKAALLRIKERQDKLAQRRPELVQLERKKAQQRRQILGR
jgi:hypothetical protein